MDREYIKSERFIHDELVRRAEAAVRHTRELWRKYGRIDSSALLWPAGEVTTTDGTKYTNVVFAELPNDAEERKTFLRQAIETVKPYGILVVEQQGKERIRAIFESHHGARSWSIPLEKHGDVYVLSSTSSKDNAEHLGLLWSPRQGTA